jgi:uncharacterized protein YyaL (SSP411 family)
MSICELICVPPGIKLISVMTPTLEPFFAGTYFPRQRFKSVLSKIADMWEDDREQCEAMGKNVIDQLKEMGGSVSSLCFPSV